MNFRTFTFYIFAFELLGFRENLSESYETKFYDF